MQMDLPNETLAQASPCNGIDLQLRANTSLARQILRPDASYKG